MQISSRHLSASHPTANKSSIIRLSPKSSFLARGNHQHTDCNISVSTSKSQVAEINKGSASNFPCNKIHLEFLLNVINRGGPTSNLKILKLMEEDSWSLSPKLLFMASSKNGPYQNDGAKNCGPGWFVHHSPNSAAAAWRRSNKQIGKQKGLIHPLW